MSALGIWNNRYEGGPCYAACMETFVLYFRLYSVIIHQSLSAGKVVIMPQEESTIIRVETRLEECVNVLQANQWEPR